MKSLADRDALEKSRGYLRVEVVGSVIPGVASEISFSEVEDYAGQTIRWANDG